MKASARFDEILNVGVFSKWTFNFRREAPLTCIWTK